MPNFVVFQVLYVEQALDAQFSLSKYIKEESLPSYFCEICGTYREAHIERKFVSLPDILSVQLKRFEFVDGLPKKLDIPGSVDLSVELELHSQSTPVKCCYNLSSVIHHNGSPTSGHCKTTVMKPNGDMFLCDDGVVSHCKRFEYKSAYVLLYRRV